MTEIKTIEAKGSHVVLKMVVKQDGGDMFKANKSGILVPNEETTTQSSGNGKLELDYALVHSIGPKVENPDFEVGDKVIFNEYDIKYVGSKENMFGIVKETSVMAVYEAEKTEE